MLSRLFTKPWRQLTPGDKVPTYGLFLTFEDPLEKNKNWTIF